MVMTGTAAAQVIGFALSPVISRLFSPSDFGIFGSFNSVSAIIAAAATLEYTEAIILQKKEEDAINLLIVSCSCTFVVGLLCLSICSLAPAFVNGLMKTEGYWALALLVASTLITGLNSSFQVWCVRAKAFKHTSASQVIRSLSGNGMLLGFGYFKIGAVGLIVGSVMADVLASLNLVRVLLPSLLALWRRIRWDRMKQLAKEYSDFPMYAATQNVITTSSQGLPVLLLGHFYGLSVVGAYAFGVSMLSTPMGFVLRSVRDVLLQRATETHQSGHSLMPLYLKTTAGLFALGLLPSLVLLIWAPEIFSLIFGSRWQTAGEFAQSLIVWLFIGFCNVAAVKFAQVIRIQRTIFYYELAMLIGRTMVLVLGGTYLNAKHTIILFSLFGATMNLFLIFLVGHSVMRREKNGAWEGLMETLLEERSGISKARRPLE